MRDLSLTSPDLVIHGGDLATHGHRPAEVVDCVRDLGWPGVAGNTDETLWMPERFEELESRMPAKSRMREVLFHELAPKTGELLGAHRIEWLHSLPFLYERDDVAVVHASPEDLWDAPPATAGDDVLDVVYRGLPGRIAVYGHIHTPFIRTVRSKVVANTGSAGLPFDGDPRASYLLVEDDWLTVRRVEYDVEEEVKDLLASGYPRAEWLAAQRRAGRFIPPE